MTAGDMAASVHDQMVFLDHNASITANGMTADDLAASVHTATLLTPNGTNANRRAANIHKRKRLGTLTSQPP